MDFDTIHCILGCKLLQRLDDVCPRATFVPTATLLACHIINISRSTPQLDLDNIDFECLYRDEDNAVGLNLGWCNIYLTPNYYT